MALKVFTGFESGNALAHVSTGSTSVVTSPVISGTYALRCSPSTTNVGWAYFSVHNTYFASITASPKFGFSFKFRYATKPASNNEQIWGMKNLFGGSVGVNIRLKSDGTLALYYLNTLIATGSTVLLANTEYRISGEYTPAGASSDYTIKIDAVTELSGTGNLGIITTGLPTVGKVENKNSNSVDFFYDDVYFDDAGEPDIAETGIIVGAGVTGDGSTMQWSGGTGASDYTQIDGLGSSDADYVSSTGSAGERALFEIDDSSTLGITGKRITAINSFIRVAQVGAGSENLQTVIKSGSTELLGTANTAMSGSYLNLSYIAYTDPDTGLAWNNSGLDAVEVGVIENSTTVMKMSHVFVEVLYEDIYEIVTDDIVADSELSADGYLTLIASGAELQAETDLTALATANLVASTQGMVGDASISPFGTSEQWTGFVGSGDSVAFAVGRVIIPNEALDKKTFLYKVYTKDGDYVGEWEDVISEFSYSQEVNNGGSQINVELARSAETRHITDTPLTEEDGDFLITESGLGISSFGETGSPFGEGTEVDLNHRVDIFLFYGFTDYLNTQSGDTVDDQDDLPLEISIGSPNGRKVFSGFISAYNARYGSKYTTIVTLSSYGDQLQNYLITEGGSVTVPYYSQDPANILRDLVDKAQADGLEVGYDDRSIENTQTVSTYIYNLNTYLDGVKKALELSPADWFWYYDMAQNLVWLRGRPSNVGHTFVLGKHFKEIDLKRDTSSIVNTVYFTGDDIDPDPDVETALFKKYQDADSVENYGQQLKLVSDKRVSLDETAYTLGFGEIDRYKEPKYTATITILTTVYPIEDIRLGELVGFRGFGNFIDELELQILRIDYNIESVTLQLGNLLPSVSKRIVDIQRNLQAQETQKASGTPVE